MSSPVVKATMTERWSFTMAGQNPKKNSRRGFHFIAHFTPRIPLIQDGAQIGYHSIRFDSIRSQGLVGWFLLAIYQYHVIRYYGIARRIWEMLGLNRQYILDLGYSRKNVYSFLFRADNPGREIYSTYNQCITLCIHSTYRMDTHLEC